MRTGSQTRLWRAAVILAMLATLSWVVAGAPSAAVGTGGRVAVVTSLQPWGSLAKEVGGDRVAVQVLLPAGASPHTFDPRPSQALALARADLVIMNGGLDEWLGRLVAATASSGRLVRLLSELAYVPPAEGSAAHETADDDGHEAGDGHGGGNSHVWLDPVMAAEAVDIIAAALAAVDPGGAELYAARAADVRAELATLDDELRGILAPVAGASMVQMHDAWVYFARRYDLHIVATVEPFPGREPSVAYLAATVATIKESGVPVIFGERQLNQASAQALADAAGVALVVLGPLGGAPGSVEYSDLMRQNARSIAEALGGG